MKNKKEKTQRQRRKSNSPGWKAGAYLKLKVSTKGAQAKSLR